MLPVEVRYLNIVWSDRETILRLETSLVPLQIEDIAGEWNVETTTFPKVFTYIGFRITDGEPEHIPYFELASGDPEYLVPVKAPGSDDIWWIQQGKWKKPIGKEGLPGRYENELFRTAGRVSLVIQQQNLVVANQTFNFSVAELEYYLADFKDSLWMLILDQGSAAKATVAKEIPNVFTDETVDLFHEFAESIAKIIKMPGMTLKETQGKRPRRDVRPVPRTFREFAVQPHARTLTSRVNFESYDTAENRYIHHCLNRVLYISRSLERVAESQTRSYKHRLDEEHKRADELEHTTSKQVDPRVYDNEISKLKHDLDELQKQVQKMTSVKTGYGQNNPELETGEYTFRLGHEYGNSARERFVETLDGKNVRKEYGSYLVVGFSRCSFNGEVLDILRNAEVKISGTYSKTQKRNSKGNTYYHIEFHEMHNAGIIDHPLKKEFSRLVGRRKTLSANDWVSELTTEERRERDREKKVVARKLAVSEDRKASLSDFSASMSMLRSRLKKMEVFFKTHKIKTQSSCPNSMIFIQNPTYAAAKSRFGKISRLSGLDESILNSLMSVDDIGLVSVANLYEKWCLLQIIRVLTNVYRFELRSDWQAKLIKAALGNEYNIELDMEHPSQKQKIVLTYEKVLESKKRPDFVIDIFSMDNSGGASGHDFGSYKEKHRNRLVLDAKFRGQIPEEQVNELVRELYETKNYSENESNSVFVIHPVPDVIENRTSPLAWGTSCDYGQSDRKGHRFGSVFLSPSLKYPNTIDHLQRLIGLFLQEISQTTQDNGSCRSNLCCIACGNADNKTLSLRHTETGSGNDRWEIICRSCELFSVQTVCAGCKHRLFKNGTKWTYHRTRAEQTSNAVCPECETFL